MSRRRTRSRRLVCRCSLAVMVGVLASCQIPRPLVLRPMDHTQSAVGAAEDYVLKFRKKPVTAQVATNFLTLDDCRSLALRNNLDFQVELIDEEVKKALKQSQRVKVLPHLLFNAELSNRDNQRFSYSEVLGQEGITAKPGQAGTGVTNYSNSHERSTWRYSLETRWSPTEAALAYFVFDTGSNDHIKEHFQALRVGQKLVGGVEAAFYRLVGLSESLPLAERLYQIRSSVAGNAKRLLKDGLVEREDYYRAKQNLLKAERLRTRVRVDMHKQRNALASAMGISPDQCADGGFSVVGTLCKPDFRADVCDLELQAVRNRPEAFMVGLTHVNSVNDLRRTIVKFFPTVTGFWRYSRDKDKFLYEKEWKEAGALVYFDLLEWIGNYRDSKATKINAVKTHRQIGSVALGIVSEVRVAGLDYIDSLDAVKNREASLGEAQQMLGVIKGRASMDEVHKVAVQEAEGEVLQEQIGRIEALAEANSALARLRATLGTNYTKPAPK
jgi:outer membrane protein TolC